MLPVFFFRVDANSQIGTGHLMRCLALAKELQNRGGECIFISQKPSTESIKLIKKNGHTIRILPEKPFAKKNQKLGYEAWLKLDWQSDASETIKIIGKRALNNWLIVDHYGIDSRWHTSIKKTAIHLLAIDDLIDKKFNVDILINQNIFFDNEVKEVTKKLPGSLLLLGPQYALLRNEFKKQPLQKSKSKKICLMFGGADAEDFTQRCVRTFISHKIHVQTIIIIGPLYKYKKELLALTKNHPQFIIYQDVHNIRELISDSTLAIGSPGVSALERCALGVPSINISIAENQIRPGKALGAVGATIYLGESTRVRDQELIHATQLLLKNQYLRNHLSKNSRNLCDGSGIEKIANHLIKKKLNIRKASENDAKQVFTWRNDQNTRIHSINPQKINWSAHKKWFSASLNDSNRNILIAEINGDAIGCMRADFCNSNATVSIFLNPDFQGQGYGVDMLASLEKWLRINHPTIKCMHAEVLPLNIASQKLFEKAGYIKKSINYFKLI